jgi:predicted nucleotidyltransferase component of viral defense system
LTEEFIKIEISLREPVLLPSQILLARTLLQDPYSNQPAFPEVKVRALSLREAYAEKVRAALTRRDPAIRDFFDIDNAVERGVFDCRDQAILDLVAEKLSVAGNDAVDTSDRKIEILVAQIAPQLRPVLRPADYERFDLQRVIALLREIVRIHLEE